MLLSLPLLENLIKGERSGRNRRQQLGDYVDRMHWDVTVCILCVFALLVGSKQHFGNPIDCFISAEIDNIDMSMIVTESSELNMERCPSDRSSKLNRVADYIFSYFYYKGIARRGFIPSLFRLPGIATAFYIITKFFYLLNALLQLYLITFFLGFPDMHWGLKVMFSLLKQQFFPRVIAGPLEFNERLSHFPYFPLEVGCNYTNLILITSVNIVVFIGSIMNKSRRQEAILSILKEKNDEDFMNSKCDKAHIFIDSLRQTSFLLMRNGIVPIGFLLSQFMGADGVLLMRFITAKAGPLTCRDVLQEGTKNKGSRESPSDTEIIAKTKRRKMKHDRMSRSTHRRARRRATTAHIDEPSMLKTERDEHDGVPKAKSPRQKENVDGPPKAGSPLKRPAEKSSKPQSSDNRFIWAQNLLLHVTTVSIRKEFIQNKKYNPAEYTFERYKQNMMKNRFHRYEDVICMDENRVILKQRPSDNDYIHANWIVMPDGQKYICTQACSPKQSPLFPFTFFFLFLTLSAVVKLAELQGPLQETLEDFWHMIVTEQCCVVVMLCPLRDGDSLYWKVPYSTVVHHFMFHDWPDHAAPLDPSPVIAMVKFARQLCNNNPIVVHCSAGIGPSVCFIGTDYVAQKVKEDPSVKMLDMLVYLRNQRLQGIQSIIQYTFLHVCVLELFVNDKIIPREGKYSEFLNSYVRMMTRYNRRVAAFITKEVEEAHPN
ncbi:unnamed protein product [Angiostrongylus costaricensis]|uniref:Ion_trans domain-containing protein n=1 Tax=Angiostrongylus costaricensis TaxID=334426 RepID=A0A158PEG2_ANGCS|nr:unnamed protein product [Angiostrongylus costaricensis]